MNGIPALMEHECGQAVHQRVEEFNATTILLAIVLLLAIVFYCARGLAGARSHKQICDPEVCGQTSPAGSNSADASPRQVRGPRCPAPLTTITPSSALLRSAALRWQPA